MDDIRLLQAIAEPTRLAIVRQLASAGPVCACDLGGDGTVSQPTLSHHLRVLREAGVIRGERRGTWIYYRLEPRAVARIAALGETLRSGASRPPRRLALRALSGRP